MNATSVQRLLRDEVLVTSRTGVDEFGQPTAGANITVRARVLHKHARSRDARGEDFTSTTQVATLHPVTTADTLTIDGVARPVRAVQSGTGLRGGVTLTVAML